MYSADEIMCANVLLSLRLNVKQAQSNSVSDRTLRYERRSKPKACVKVQEDECSREERYKRRCLAKEMEEKRNADKRFRQNVLPVLKQLR
jgi:hypothetical protein